MIIPEKLKKGDNIRIIAPSCSGKTISKHKINAAKKILESIGFTISFGKNIFELNDLESSSVKSRLKDLHDAFRDKNIKGVLAIRGGYNANDLLDYIDWGLIKNNSKVYCGYSDNTALQNAILAKTGMITYSGPNFTTFGVETKLDYTLNHFLNTVTAIETAPLKNFGNVQILNKGRARGAIIGGNLCTFNLLQGTQYMPDLNETVLFVEDDFISNLDFWEFHRNLQSVINLPNFQGIKALVIGKFDKRSRLPVNKIREIVKSKPELRRIPVIANLSFGHVLPIFTFPIGGNATIDTSKKSVLTFY